MRATILFSTLLMSSFSQGMAQDPSPTTLTPKQCKISGIERIVPNLLGYDPADAKKIIEACDLVYDGATDVHTLSYEAIGKVGDQEPSGGEVVSKGTTVRGFVSVGLFVPNMVGWEAKNAEKYLRDFRHGVTTLGEANAAPVGTVFAHVPGNGELYNSGTAVILKVSEGPWFILPDFKNKQYIDSQKEISSLGLITQHVAGEIKDDSEYDGDCTTMEWTTYVVQTDPASGAKVFPGQKIEFTTKVVQSTFLAPSDGEGGLCN